MKQRPKVAIYEHQVHMAVQFRETDFSFQCRKIANSKLKLLERKQKTPNPNLYYNGLHWLLFQEHRTALCHYL